MTLSDEELQFLTKTLRRRKRRDYLISWVFSAFFMGMFLAALTATGVQQTPNPVMMVLMALFLGLGLASSGFAWIDWARESRRRKLLAVTLRLINNDPEVLQQLSAKHGLGDLSA